METPLGLLVTFAISGRISKQRGWAIRSRSSREVQFRGAIITSTDDYIHAGRIGALKLSSACFSWYEVLRLAAWELHAKGEADTARALRSGSVTGRRQALHRPNWTPDRADLHEFLKTMERAKT